jgi:general secretion pathway protein M
VRKLTLQQSIALGVLGLLLLACAGVVAWSLQARADAADELAERQDHLARLEAGTRPKGDPRRAKLGAAPPSAFLDAPTSGLASASLQSHIAHLAGHHATLVSFAVQPSDKADSADSVRVEASMDIGLRSLQTLLYELESGTPYVFVESMTVRPAAAAAAAQSTAKDPSLRVVIGLRALWRRSPG